MFAADVDYHRANSVEDAVRLLRENAGAKLLAGGHSLLPLMKLRLASPSALIDIGRIEALRGITVSGEHVRIGALTTHAELATSADAKAACPILSAAASTIGDPAVRNRATVGGNVSHADPASDLPTVILALGGRFIVNGPGGERTIEAAEFFQGLMSTALSEDEVLTAIEVPAGKPGQGMAYSKFSHPASRYAVIGAAAVVTLDSGSYTAASVAVGGATPSPTKASSVEAALVGKSAGDDAHGTAANAVVNDLGDDVLGDVFASADYRKSMAAVYVKRALDSAAESVG